MKRTLLMIFVVCAVTQARATIAIDWGTGGAAVKGSDGITDLLAPSPFSGLFQLMFSSDNVAGLANPDGTTAGDTILDQVVYDGSADAPAEFFSSSYNALFTPGFVYMRVFDVGTSIGNTPVNTYYLTGPVIALVDKNLGAGDTPQEVRLGAGLGPFSLNTQVVPEPSVFAFLGIGGAVIALRRRMAKA